MMGREGAESRKRRKNPQGGVGLECLFIRSDSSCTLGMGWGGVGLGTQRSGSSMLSRREGGLWMQREGEVTQRKRKNLTGGGRESLSLDARNGRKRGGGWKELSEEKMVPKNFPLEKKKKIYSRRKSPKMAQGKKIKKLPLRENNQPGGGGGGGGTFVTQRIAEEERKSNPKRVP